MCVLVYTAILLAAFIDYTVDLRTIHILSVFLLHLLIAHLHTMSVVIDYMPFWPFATIATCVHSYRLSVQLRPTGLRRPTCSTFMTAPTCTEYHQSTTKQKRPTPSRLLNNCHVQTKWKKLVFKSCNDWCNDWLNDKLIPKYLCFLPVFELIELIISKGLWTYFDHY